MPLCGFNQEMLEGLEKFHKSLVERLIEKSMGDKTPSSNLELKIKEKPE